MDPSLGPSCRLSSSLLMPLKWSCGLGSVSGPSSGMISSPAAPRNNSSLQCLHLECSTQLSRPSQCAVHDTPLQLGGGDLFPHLAERSPQGGGGGGDEQLHRGGHQAAGGRHPEPGPGVRRTRPGAQPHHVGGPHSIQPSPGLPLRPRGSHRNLPALAAAGQE